MKIKNIDLTKKSVQIIPIIKGDQEIIFQAECVTDYTQFDALVKKIEPPMRINKGETIARPNFESPDYKKSIEDYASKQTSWMILKSLEATEGLTWETIDMSNPSTWNNFEKELKAANFNDYQIIQIIKGVIQANGLDDTKVEAARKSFLATKQAAEKLN